jgi:hypothetical protein
MKRVFILLAVIGMLIPGLALAEWEVTVTWTPSVGPNLDKEEVLLDGQVITSLPANASGSHTFTLVELTGQEVAVRAYNTQGLKNAEDLIIGNCEPIPFPASPTGGAIIIRWK